MVSLFTVDDRYKPEDFDLRVLDVFEDPTSADFSRNLLDIPNQAGRRLVNEKIETRPIQIAAKFYEDDHVDVNQKLNDLKSIFQDENGKYKEIKLEIDHWQNKYVKAHLATPIDSDRKRMSGELTLDFICYDPLKYSTINASEIAWGNEVIDFTSSYKMGHTGVEASKHVNTSTSLNIEVDGLTFAPVFKLDGRSDSVTFELNGQSFTLGQFNGVWEIEQYSAKLNGQERFVDNRRLKLKQGQNELKITGSNMNFDLDVDFRDRYN